MTTESTNRCSDDHLLGKYSSNVLVFDGEYKSTFPSGLHKATLVAVKTVWRLKRIAKQLTFADQDGNQICCWLYVTKKNGEPLETIAKKKLDDNLRRLTGKQLCAGDQVNLDHCVNRNYWITAAKKKRGGARLVSYELTEVQSAE